MLTYTTYTTAEANQLAKQAKTPGARIVTESLGAFQYRKSVLVGDKVVFTLIGATVPGRGRGQKHWWKG